MGTDLGTEATIQIRRGELLDAMAAGAVVLTGNARLARHVSAEYERRMLAEGRQAWATPSVLPLSAWLLDTYEGRLLVSGAPLPRLLTPDQEQQVWASIIAREGPGLLRIDAAAQRAMETWKRLCDWRVDLEDPRFAYSEDSEAFKGWAVRFQDRCSEGGLASESELPRLLADWIEKGESPVPDRLLLAGFYDPAPSQQRLVSALRNAGCDVDWVAVEGRSDRVRRLGAPDGRGEIAAAAEWAREVLLADPDARVGIVVPDLAARRSSLAHQLNKTLNPEALRADAPARPPPWNLSLGIALSRVPIVQTALELLSLAQPPVDIGALGALLASPHWGLPEDRDARRDELNRRALLDRRLRSRGDAAMPLSAIRYEAGRTDESDQPQPWTCALLGDRLENLAEAHRDLPARAVATEWAGALANWLSLAGWPRGRPLNSDEFQAVEAWNAVLSRFSALGEFAGTLTRRQALALLGRLAGETIFQPRAGDASVQVLGLYEANSLRFDNLWVMGLHDATWPPAARPDPFIPLAIQRECGMPHCTPEAEWAWAARVTADLAGSAAHVVFSWPRREESEELACSPLIGQVRELPAGTLPAGSEDRWFERIQRSARAELVPAPSPIALRQAEVAGGSRVYAHQAACPFRAFAEHRLGARPLDRPGVGLGAMRSGTLLHRVLETLWGELRTQAALLALDEDELSGRVKAAVEEVLEAQRRRSPVTLSPRYLGLEAGRLQARVMGWLEQERARSPFRVVELEQRRNFEMEGVRVKIFLDRIDELDDGTRVVLDYKTGQVRPSAWFGERPEDPQLPLYGVASFDEPDGQPPAAVAFAQIRPNGAAFSGVVREAGILPGLPVNRTRALMEASADWPSVLQEWTEVLGRLAAAFREGRAEVDPKKGLTTCRQGFCELAPLCRVREHLSEPGDGGDGEDPSIESGKARSGAHRNA